MVDCEFAPASRVAGEEALTHTGENTIDPTENEDMAMIELAPDWP